MIVYIAIGLIGLRIIALFYLVHVIKIQLDLMKRPIDPEITGYRKKLYYLTLGLVASNLIPILFDIFIILRQSNIMFEGVSTRPFLIVYGVSNASASLLAAILLARIYRNSVQIDESHTKSDHTLMND